MDLIILAILLFFTLWIGAGYMARNMLIDKIGRADPPIFDHLCAIMLGPFLWLTAKYCD